MAEAAYHKMRRDVVPAPAGCPVDHAFSPFSDAYLENPYSVLEELRGTSPTFYSAELGYLVLTRMEDVAEVFRNPDLFASENVQDPVLPLCAAAAEILAAPDYNPIAVLSNRPRPDHTRIRKHAHAGFSSRRMGLLEPFIRRRCETLVDAMLARGAPAEFLGAVGFPLPGETIFRLLGFSQSDDARLKEWTTSRLTFTWGKASDDEQVDIARKVLAYWRYCVSFVKARRAEPADDFTSELLAVHDADPEELGLREVESIVYGLSVAGHEIVTNYLSNALITLLANRKHWDELRADPELIPNALEEVLRFNSPQTSWRRLATRDCQLAGYEIPAGTQIFLSLASANHDEAQFQDPGTFDMHRTNARAHISFGRGIHFCLGNRLAILEAIITLETLIERVPSLALVADREPGYIPNFTFRGPKELWLTWSD